MKHLASALVVASTWVHVAFGQMSASYCDPVSGICYQGFTDKPNSVTFGFVFPPVTNPPANEFIVQMVSPITYGWTGLSVGGGMQSSLLLTSWANDQHSVLGSRWTSTYTRPLPYFGPQLTLLPDSTINSTHIKATFRCQNCTTWRGGSVGSGDLNGLQFIAYAFSKSSKPTHPEDVNSDFPMHDAYGYFALNLLSAHDVNYFSHFGGSSSAPPPFTTTTTTTPPPPPPTTTTTTTPPPPPPPTSPPPPPPTTTTTTTPPPPPPPSTNSTTTPPYTTTSTTMPPPGNTTTTPPYNCAPSPTTKIPEPAATWGQCGGLCYYGPFICPSGTKCFQMDGKGYYNQCLPATQAPTTATTVTTTTPPTAPTTTTTTTTGTQTQTNWGQCGGQGWTGPTVCASGIPCVTRNQYYYQCSTIGLVDLVLPKATITPMPIVGDQIVLFP